MLRQIAPELCLFPPRRNPYYIVAPSYTRQSAGIKALHLLCHTLNHKGQNAFLVHLDIRGPRLYQPMGVNHSLLTPVLTRAANYAFYEQGLTPIVVYPEIVTGNPLKADLVIRYVLNYPGLLGGDKSYPPSEVVFAYSSALADAVGVGDDRVLFVPASDTNVFYAKPGDARRGSCFYAAKYRAVHSGPLLDVTRNSVEIRRGKDAQTPDEIAELFRISEIFFAYENTALAIEAMLCGCPTVFLPNDHLTEVIAAKELGWDGFAWGTDPAEIARAKATVERGHNHYVAAYRKFWTQLDTFVTITQELAQSRRQADRIDINVVLSLLFRIQRVRFLRKLTTVILILFVYPNRWANMRIIFRELATSIRNSVGLSAS